MMNTSRRVSRRTMYASGFGGLASAVCLSAVPFDQAEAQTGPESVSTLPSVSANAAAGAPPRSAATARALPPALHKGGRAGGFQNIRSNDSFPRPAPPGAPWQERAKHVALTDDGRIWVTFSGEERLLIQAFDRPSIGVAPTNSVLSFQFRHQYGADLHLGENLRVFGQIVSGQVTCDVTPLSHLSNRKGPPWKLFEQQLVQREKEPLDDSLVSGLINRRPADADPDIDERRLGRHAGKFPPIVDNDLVGLSVDPSELRVISAPFLQPKLWPVGPLQALHHCRNGGVLKRHQPAEDTAGVNVD